jgi:hypothetical protein
MLATKACDENSSVGGNFLLSERTELIDSFGWAVVFSVAIDKTGFVFSEKKDLSPLQWGYPVICSSRFKHRARLPALQNR